MTLPAGAATHLQATSLQAFWPGMQVLLGDVGAAAATHARFMGVWKRFGVFPERFMYKVRSDGSLTRDDTSSVRLTKRRCDVGGSARRILTRDTCRR